MNTHMQPDFHGTTLEGAKIRQLRKAAYEAFMEQGHKTVSLADPSVDGEQLMNLQYVPVTTVACSIFKDRALRNHIHYSPRPVFDENGQRVIFDYPSGLSWQILQLEAEDDVTLMLMGVYSDEAKCLTNMMTYGLYGQYYVGVFMKQCWPVPTKWSLMMRVVISVLVQCGKCYEGFSFVWHETGCIDPYAKEGIGKL
jgi:hypothetical protein